MMNLTMAIHGDSKVGKALPDDAPVLTPLGWKRIDQLKVGDAICHPSGGLQTVTGVFPQGVRELFDVVFNDGVACRCDAEHLWTTQTDGETSMKTRSLSEVVDAGVLTSDGRERFRIPLVQPLQMQEAAQLAIDPYLLGVLLGDGCLRASEVSLTTDAEIIDRLVLPEGVTARLYKGAGADAVTTALSTPRGQRNPLKQALRDHGLVDHYSHEKFVPPGYLQAPPTARHALLQGLLDTDAWTNGKMVQFTTTAPGLRDAVVALTQSLGGVARVSTKLNPKYVHNEEVRYGRDAYNVSVTLPAALAPFRLSRKAEKYPGRKKGVRRAISEVNPAGAGSARCIKVSAPDGLFVTNDYIVTHNTWMAATFPRPVFISAAPERGWTALPAHPNWSNITVLPCPLIPGQEQISGDPSAPPPPEWATVKDDKRRLPIADMEYIVLRRIREEYKQRDWRTVVIDTTTIYDEMVVSQLSDYGKLEMGGKGGGQWNVVKQHMLNMVNALQTLPLNIVWVFHSKYIKTGDIVLKIEPGAVGSHWEKVFAPTVRIIGYLKKEETLDQATGEMMTTRALLLKCPPNFNPPVVAGGNFEHLFQGKDWCLKPHWDSLAQRLEGTFKVD